MKAKIRSDGLHIVGYVNVPGRMSSRPVITSKHGKCMEVIEQRAFANAIAKSGDIKVCLDHEREIAKMSNGTLKLCEDNVGLRAETIITDKEVIDNVDKLKGWSFQMKNVVDSVEQRADSLPIRHVKSFEMPEISLILHKNPVYASTSIELRAEDDEGEEREERYEQRAVQVDKENPIDYTSFKNRISAARITER